MYGTSEVKGDAGKPQFMAGITENSEIIKVAYENSKQDGTGKDVLAFTFKAPNGAEFRKIFWEVDPARVIDFNQKYPKNHSRNNDKLGIVAGQPITDEQAVNLAFSEFNRQIKHIMTKYMSEEDAVIANVNSYKDFAMQVCKKLAGKFNGKKMRIKLIYQKNGFLDIPRFGNFLEPMGDTSSLTITQYDKIKRDAPSSDSEVEDALLADSVTNDLPF